MKQFILTSLTAALMTFNALASTEVCIDHKRKVITLSAHYYFYGWEATADTAKKCVDEINRQFNNGHRIMLNKQGEWLNVSVKVTHSVVDENSAATLSASNYDPKINFVRIDTPTKGSRVTVSEHGLSSNYGYFITKNGLGNSTTCTHEFAHGLGLVHIDPCDWRGKGVPPIMAARGCLVDSKFQYNPSVKAGAIGGTINPSTRQVHSKEFSLINMGDLDYKWVTQNKECASQGKSSKRIYNRDGSTYLATSPFVPWLGGKKFTATDLEAPVVKAKKEIVHKTIEGTKEVSRVAHEISDDIHEGLEAFERAFITIKN